MLKLESMSRYVIRHGLGVRIAGSHPAGPGSIPGAGTLPFVVFLFHILQYYLSKHF